MASAPNLVLIGEIFQENSLVDSHGFKKIISRVDVAVYLISVASIAEVSYEISDSIYTTNKPASTNLSVKGMVKSCVMALWLTKIGKSLIVTTSS